MNLTVGSTTQSWFRMPQQHGARGIDTEVPPDRALSFPREDAAGREGKLPRADDGACKTCENRKYQDGSDDAGVSYQNPTKIDPGAVAGAVRGHEMEHVYRERFQAESEGRRILYQNVTLHNGICPECGKVYISGGTTRTVSQGDAAKQAARFRVGLPDESPRGSNLSAAV